MALKVESLSIRSSAREEMVDITEQVGRVVNGSGIRFGMVWVCSPHTTAGITINENADPDVIRDLQSELNRIVPRNGRYRHSEGNSDAHIKASLLGCSELLSVQDGSLVLGTWQKIFFCEFDGPRSRKVYFKVK